MRTVIVTGGAGFIGSNFVLHAVRSGRYRVVTLDKLTYAGNRENLAEVEGDPRHVFVHGDIVDRPLVARLLEEHDVSAVLNFAAESHVDRSIDGPDAFVRTNILGVFELLEATRAYLAERPREAREAFRFLHVSTDEVYGSLGPSGVFSETTPYAPSSPYSASKASADHLVRAYHTTYGLPTLTTNSANNFGPYQFPEKLVPLVVLNALEGKPLPLYGDGKNVRDWLYVEDHVKALFAVLERGRVGETYAIGARCERENLDVVRAVCKILDELVPEGAPHERLISFVKDRPGHDRRCAVDPGKIERELGFRTETSFEEGLAATVRWYLGHRAWCDAVTARGYARERLGLHSSG